MSHRKHTASVTKPNRLMLFRETVAACCENHIKHINALCGQNGDPFNIKAGDTYSYHCSRISMFVSPCAGVGLEMD
jgi:hypothetical protein